MDTLQSVVLTISIMLLVVAAIILVFVVFIAWRRELLKRGTHPALLRFIHEAIVLAYKSSDSFCDMVDDRLHGVQKKQIADAVYDLLPEYISITFLNFKMPWKSYVSKEQFSEFVQAEYDKLVEKFSALKNTILREMLETMQEGSISIGQV